MTEPLFAGENVALARELALNPTPSPAALREFRTEWERHDAIVLDLYSAAPHTPIPAAMAALGLTRGQVSAARGRLGSKIKKLPVGLRPQSAATAARQPMASSRPYNSDGQGRESPPPDVLPAVVCEYVRQRRGIYFGFASVAMYVCKTCECAWTFVKPDAKRNYHVQEDDNRRYGEQIQGHYTSLQCLPRPAYTPTPGTPAVIAASLTPEQQEKLEKYDMAVQLGLIEE